MNVLMIGTGDIAYSHGRAVVKLGGKVYACYDVNVEGMKRIASQVLSALKSGTAASPDCLRQIIREELAAALSTAVIAMPAAVEQGANISAAEQMQNDQAILDDLELFG